LSALETFAGVAHRCQWVASQAGVDYFNDSKATNVGATLAALKGLSRRPGDIVLIAGGVAKGADFAPLARGVEHLKALVVMGEAAAGIAAAFGGAVETVRVADMEAAVDAAAGLAQPGERVLLAPACASFDMYANFEARGDDFMRLVAVRGDA
jgi:UDP-N-acetylmuramoylalanine--D-glutamate ligase